MSKELLDSIESAADAIVNDTRAEAQRRIEEAGRRATAIAGAADAIEQAERGLVDRASAFAESARALRTELDAFTAKLAQGARSLQPGLSEGAEADAVLTAGDSGASAEPAPAEDEPGPEPADREPLDAEDEDSAAAEGSDAEVQAEADELPMERPTPEQLDRFYRQVEEAERRDAISARDDASRLPLRYKLGVFGAGLAGLVGASAILRFLLLE